MKGKSGILQHRVVKDNEISNYSNWRSVGFNQRFIDFGRSQICSFSLVSEHYCSKSGSFFYRVYFSLIFFVREPFNVTSVSKIREGESKSMILECEKVKKTFCIFFLFEFCLVKARIICFWFMCLFIFGDE